MAQGVLDGVVAIEAKAAKLVEDAKREAQRLRSTVKAELDRLAQQLAREADEATAAHAAEVEVKKQACLAEIQEQVKVAMDALDVTRSKNVDPMVAEVARLLEQGGHGH
jgi:hypothetical protein